MRAKNDKPSCEVCGRGKARRLSYRYTDDKHKYLHSKRWFIKTGYLFLCSKHLKKWTKPSI